MTPFLTVAWAALTAACGQPTAEAVNPAPKAREIRLSDFEGTWDNLLPDHNLRTMTIRGHTRTMYDRNGQAVPYDFIYLAGTGQLTVIKPPERAPGAAPGTLYYEFDDDGVLYLTAVRPGGDVPPGPEGRDPPQALVPAAPVQVDFAGRRQVCTARPPPPDTTGREM
jgi:hypothetical protein